MTDTRPDTAKTMTIPQIRAEMIELAETLGSDRLRYLADQTWRRPLEKPPAKAKYPCPDEEKAEAIRQYVAANPDAGQETVARIFGTTGGRVSEVLRGKRGE